MTEPASVRRAGPDDLEALVPLFDAYRGFYRRPSDAAGARAFLRARLERGDSVVFLAEDGERALGFVQLYPTFSSVRMGRWWVLNDLFVAPEARRRGVGRALMERAARHAAETGAEGMELATEKTNERAAALYRSLGWEREEELDRYELFP